MRDATFEQIDEAVFELESIVQHPVCNGIVQQKDTM